MVAADIEEKSPILTLVLRSLPAAQKKKLHEYAQVHGFHRGRQWFGTGMRPIADSTLADQTSVLMLAESNAPDPLAVAFDLTPNFTKSGWFSARVDENMLDAIKHVVFTTRMNEEGMERYMRELENTSPTELAEYIAFTAASE